MRPSIKCLQETFQDNYIVSNANYTIPNDCNYQDAYSVPVIDISELVGRFFLVSAPEEIYCLRVKIVKDSCSHQDYLNYTPTLKDSIVMYRDKTIEEIISYNQILHHIQNQDHRDQIEWRFKLVVSCEEPFRLSYPDFNGSLYNVMIEWENGDITSETLTVIVTDDPVSFAPHAKEFILLENPGQQYFKRLSKRENDYFNFKIKPNSNHIAHIQDDIFLWSALEK